MTSRLDRQLIQVSAARCTTTGAEEALLAWLLQSDMMVPLDKRRSGSRDIKY